MNYYKLTIQYQGQFGVMTEERVNQTPPPNVPDGVWITQLREKLYSTGFTVVIADDTYEFISPFKIHCIYLVKQQIKEEADQQSSCR